MLKRLGLNTDKGYKTSQPSETLTKDRYTSRIKSMDFVDFQLFKYFILPMFHFFHKKDKSVQKKEDGASKKNLIDLGVL